MKNNKPNAQAHGRDLHKPLKGLNNMTDDKQKQPCGSVTCSAELGAGDTFLWRGRKAKIMAVADGYAMARLKGCMPFIVRLKEIKNEVKP